MTLSNLHRLNVVNIDGTVQHIQNITVFNGQSIQSIVCYFISYNKRGTIFHVKNHFVRAVSLFTQIVADADTKAVYQNCPLSKGFVGQGYILSQLNKYFVICVGLVIDPFCQDGVGKHFYFFLFSTRHGLFHQLLTPEFLQLGNCYLRC